MNFSRAVWSYQPDIRELYSMMWLMAGREIGCLKLFWGRCNIICSVDPPVSRSAHLAACPVATDFLAVGVRPSRYFDVVLWAFHTAARILDVSVLLIL